MEDQKKLILLIVNHLKNQMISSTLSDESLERMKLAVQYIVSVYNLNPSELFNVDSELEKIVIDHYKQASTSQVNMTSEVSDAAMKEAKYHNTCGNEFMKNKNNEMAIEAYSRSILQNPKNAMYYGNRAAAYNGIGKYQEAIKDCEIAIKLDSTYCKAYCRMGLAFTYLKDYQRAAFYYKSAYDINPNNMGYRKNFILTLEIMKKKIEQNLPQRYQQQEIDLGESSTPQPPIFSIG